MSRQKKTTKKNCILFIDCNQSSKRENNHKALRKTRTSSECGIGQIWEIESDTKTVWITWWGSTKIAWRQKNYWGFFLYLTLESWERRVTTCTRGHVMIHAAPKTEHNIQHNAIAYWICTIHHSWSFVLLWSTTLMCHCLRRFWSGICECRRDERLTDVAQTQYLFTECLLSNSWLGLKKSMWKCSLTNGTAWIRIKLKTD